MVLMTDGFGTRARTSADADFFDGWMTLAAFVFAFAAFDDITTDHATSFRAEYTLLLICAAWGAALNVRLAWRGRSGLAGACTALLLAVLWGQQSIGPGTRAGVGPGYLMASAALLGFVVVAIYLVITGAGFGGARSVGGAGSGRES